jgi:DNA repair exonuclease SbcCD ATPase subunit
VLNQTLKLGRAYETLKDESKRRAYDLIYPSIIRSRPSPQTTQTTRPPHASTPQSGALSEAAQIAALQKSKQERGARWWTKKNAFESSIFELQRDIRRLEQEINNLDSIAVAEAAEEAQKNSWGTWLLSPIYKKAEESEEEKAHKDRERQERRIEKDMKERRLGLKNADLEKEESRLRKAKEEVNAADLVDNGKIRVFQDRTRARETWERQERERVERERIARIWKQQQEERGKREREAAEALRKQQAEERAAEQKRQEEQAKKWQKIIDDETKKYREQYAHLDLPECFFTADGSTRQASTSTCPHDGWWPKVQGRTACPECCEIWNYLLQCPGCKMKACPRCQATIRPRIPRNAARTNRRAPPRVRTPSPYIFYNDY